MSESTDLDPGYLRTHDDPKHANAELTARQAKEAALVLVPFVWWRAPIGNVQYKAIVTRVYAPECVDLLVLPEASIDIGSGYGVPHAFRSVVLGPGRLNFQMEIDP